MQDRTAAGWKMALRCVCLMAFATLTQIANTSADAQVRSQNTINVFGNWRIEIIKENRSLDLIGIVTEGRGAFFSSQCFAEGTKISLVVPTWAEAETAAARRRGQVRLTVWNEHDAPVDVSLVYSPDGSFGLAIFEPNDKSEPGAAFIQTLRRSRQFFAFEAGGDTRHYDAKNLGTALKRFDELCQRARSDWGAIEGLIR